MWIKYLKLLNFRNYESVQLNFHSALNIIYGKNGMGKTNLVEAIYVLGLTRSFRLVNDYILIHQKASSAKIEGIVHNRLDTNYKIILSKEGKKVKINNNKVSKLSDYVSKINIILFHPNDLKIIKDTPSIRRKTLNIDISQLNLNYLRYLNSYNKVLKQRNAYLKQLCIDGTQSSTYLNILTEKLIDYGLKLYEERKNFIDMINEHIDRIYKNITGEAGLILEYLSDYSHLTRQEIVNLYQKSLKKDLSFGKTNVGIHTDDFIFYLNTFDLKEYGSEGQQKNAIIAMKFAELELFHEQKGYYPILILDDLFSELDDEKVENILHFLSREIQVFITTTDKKHFEKIVTKEKKCFKVQNGIVTEV